MRPPGGRRVPGSEPVLRSSKRAKIALAGLGDTVPAAESRNPWAKGFPPSCGGRVPLLRRARPLLILRTNRPAGWNRNPGPQLREHLPPPRRRDQPDDLVAPCWCRAPCGHPISADPSQPPPSGRACAPGAGWWRSDTPRCAVARTPGDRSASRPRFVALLARSRRRDCRLETRRVIAKSPRTAGGRPCTGWCGAKPGG